MSIKDLHHDHARELLHSRLDIPALNARVAEVLGTERASSCQVFAHDFFIDVPIPFVFEVDAYTRARLPNGELYVSLNGEAYDRRYALRVQVRRAEEGPWILPLGQVARDEAHRLWRDGWQAVERAGLVLTSTEERIALLRALLPECFAEDVSAIARWAAVRGGHQPTTE